MKRIIPFLLVTMIIALMSCEKEEVQTKLLTSKVWGQPTVIHQPSNLAFWSEGTCPAGHAYKYNDDGSYNMNNYCSNIELTGSWRWIENNEELELETYFKDIFQITYHLSIIELSDSLFHFQVRKKDDSTDHYHEMKQYPRGTN